MATPTKREWGDWINPVLVKEVRQCFHNNLILGVMAALLLGQLVLLVVMQYQEAELEYNEYSGNGLAMFSFILVGMGLATYLIASLGVMMRFSTERRNRDLDFSFLTTLSSNRIIWGKLAGSIVMTVFIAALCLPFMVIAYFLRGIEMWRMLILTAMLLPPVWCASQLGILIGAAGKRWLLPIFLIISFLSGLFIVVFMVIMSSEFSNIDSPVGILLLWWGIFGIVLELLYALSVAAINSRYSNRMLPVRLSLLGVIALAPFIGLGGMMLADSTDYVESILIALGIVGALTGGMCSIIASFERLEPGARVLRKRPKNPLGRFGHFLISSGAPGGVSLSYMILFFASLTSLVLYGIDERVGHDLFLWVAGGCYFLFYTNLALLLSTRRNSLPGAGWWGVVIAVLLIFPLMAGGLLSVFDRSNASFYLITTPFCVSGLDDPGMLIFVGPVLAILSGAALVTFRRERGGKA